MKGAPRDLMVGKVRVGEWATRDAPDEPVSSCTGNAE